MIHEFLSNYVLDMLSSNHPSCDRVNSYYRPSQYFIIGTLADSSKDWAAGESTAKMQSKTAMRHNSMSIMFLVDKNKRQFEISIKPSSSVYYKVFPTFNEQKTHCEKTENKTDPGFTTVYKKQGCNFEPISYNISQNEAAFDLDFQREINLIQSDDDVYRKNKDILDLLSKKLRNGFDPSWIKDEDIYNSIIDKMKEKNIRKIYNWSAEICCERENFNDICDIISIKFINTTEGKRVNPYYTFLFNCGLEIDLNGLQIVPFEYNYKNEGYDYLQKGFLRALNCHADYHDNQNIIKTKPYDIFFQKKRAPRTIINGIGAYFKDLKNNLKNLEMIKAEMKKHQQKYHNHSIYKNEDHAFNVQFVEETKNYDIIFTRFSEGLNILKNSTKARKSFFLMNSVFEKSAQGKYDTWRLFQIVFIVMNIPEITNPSKNRDIVEIIHVNTGGGKSEAYFGLVIFLLFWDRLRGKKAGVSAFTKFPLRMLSIQQLQRIANLAIIAEDFRINESIEGDPFSLGYYVGTSDDFPRYSIDRREQIIKSSSKDEKIEGILLDKCPFCENNVFLSIEEGTDKIIHKCENCSRKFYLYFTNEEIYRFLPSFIVSTVDKLASVSLNRRFKNLLGGKLSKCEKHGYIPINDKCEVTVKKGMVCDSKIKKVEQFEGPSLMIQDEMHLLREGFGTINSHFESLLNSLLKYYSNKEFKYITMTATVAGAKRQIDHLYGKKAFIFPGNVPRGYDEKDDFFFEYIVDDNKSVQIQRILIGLKPNLRDNQFSSLLTIYHLSTFIKKVRENLEDYSQQWNITKDDLIRELQKYQAILTYHGKKADVFGMKYYIHPVVESKLENINVVSKTLTGDNELIDIKNTIKTIEEFPSKNNDLSKIHATFATSIVSHGVDIDNWNLMIFQGMTNNTAEYIQALSRVGRKYIGIVFLWYYPNRVRDLSYYKNFSLYHEILQKKVEKTPISRWTKLGFKQTFTSLFCGAILNYFSDVIEQPLYKVEEVNQVFEDMNNRRILIEFLQKAYYSDMERVGAKWINQNISDEVEKRLNYLIKSRSIHKNFFPNALKDCDDPYFGTQYGMRGIQPEVKLEINHSYLSFIKRLVEDEE